MRLIMIIVGLLLFSSAYAQQFELTSTGFANNTAIPAIYTCNGSNLPPPLTWNNAPANTHAFAVVVTNPDSQVGQPFYNWVVFNIPANATGLTEGKKLPADALTGNNTFGDAAYAGPCPENSSVHHYVFTVYALDAALDLSAEANADDVMTNIRQHTLAKASISGTFQH